MIIIAAVKSLIKNAVRNPAKSAVRKNAAMITMVNKTTVALAIYTA